MADELHDLPYKAEYSKSGRASCKACKSTIEKDSLRLAVMVQSHMFDGKVPHWYHYACFFTKQRPKTPGDIEHFDSLRWEDQEKIKQKIDNGPGVAVTKSKSKTSKRAVDSAASKDFCVEYAKSSRAMCRGCEIKIAKEEVRISKKDFESDDAKRYGGKDLWHHVDCFAKLRTELEFYGSGDTLPGFKSLKKEDQATVKKALPQIKQEANGDSVDGPSGAKKIKKEEGISDSDPLLKKQNKLFFTMRDQLKDLKKKELHSLLEYNGQAIPIGFEECLDRVADCMVFGSLKNCEVCKTGQFVYKTGIGYQCEGDLSAYTKCLKIEPYPQRGKFKIPSGDIEDYPFLNKYKSKIQKRIIVPLTSTVVKVKTEDETDSSGPKIERVAPLKNMSFFTVGKLNRDKEMLKRSIVKMGGTMASKLTPEITAVISTEAEIEKEGSKMEEVKQLGIHVIPETYFDECHKGNAIELISDKAISSWGTSVQKRIDAGILKSGSLKSKSRFTKSESKVTLKLKGGLAVDPDSHLEDIAHVYVSGKTVYSTVLSKTNVQKSQNKFYKLQLLQGDNDKKFWLFRSWGRIGTTVGDSKVEKYSNLNSARDKFEELFEEKTGHSFCELKTMTKLPDHYFPVDIDYGQDDDVKMDTTSLVPSKLAEPVQKLVSLLFDVNLMKKVMLEFELDLEKMPLGRLSKKQINMAYSVLSELQKKDGDFKPAIVVDATNRFYSIIPHSFGMMNPPLLDNKEIIQSKLEMLESLMEMETAYRLLKETKEESDGEKHPLDAHYTKLKTTIEVVETTSQEFNVIEKYVKNTHAQTHSTYQLEILHLYKVQREGEEKRFKPFKKLHNRKLLWHGSRITNYAGILSQGLRIAPPEAPMTGYMFGKGIYFADMVSKSANYCMTSKDNSTGLLLLCEVALGEMYERTHAEYVTELPSGKHSTKGVGATSPDPSESVVLDDGLEVPLGKGVKMTEMSRTSLLYNEYIVYDPAQVKAKYLLKVKFNYNY